MSHDKAMAIHTLADESFHGAWNLVDASAGWTIPGPGPISILQRRAYTKDFPLSRVMWPLLLGEDIENSHMSDDEIKDKLHDIFEVPF